MTTETKTVRLTYLVHYPRDFSNEYDVYAGTKSEIDRIYAILDRRTERGSQLERINRGEAIRLGWTRRRQAKRDGEQWFGGFAEPSGSPYPYPDPSGIAQEICNAHAATVAMIDIDEASREDDEPDR